MLPGDGASTKYETNVNVCPDKDHVSTMMVKGGPTSSRVRVNTSEENRDVQPEDFDVVSHQSVLMEGMNQLRLKEHLLDVKLKAEGRYFKAHRVVLSACSDYFRAMFTDPMRERSQDEIQLSGVNAEGLELVLEYIYTSKLSLTLANIQTVLSTATHLQILQVIGACSAYLRRQLDMINCVDVITLAETYALPRLRRFAYNYISENFMNLTRQQMNRLTLEQVDHLLGGDYPVNASELSILKIILEWLENAQGTSGKRAVATLLSRIDFGQISREDLKGLVGKTQNENVLAMLRDQLMHCDKLIDFRDEQGLLNLRGMQLSIVKVGGFGPCGITNKIAYFSSVNTWLPLSTIPHIECSNFGCAVLQNTLYVIGGCFNQTDSLATLTEHVHPFGFAYNPRKDSWSRIAPMNRERCRFTLVPCGRDKLVAIGGSGNLDASLNGDDDDDFMGLEEFDPTVEVYECDTDRWRYLSPLPNGAGRSQHAATSISDSKVIVSGGISSDLVILDDCLTLNLNSNEWTATAKLLQPRADHVMIQINSHEILVVGGWSYDQDNQRLLIDTIDKFNHDLGTWEIETRIPTPRFHCGVALVKDKLHIVGGFHSDLTFDRATGFVEVYDLKTKAWTRGHKNYPEDTWEHACVALHIPSIRKDEIESE